MNLEKGNYLSEAVITNLHRMYGQWALHNKYSINRLTKYLDANIPCDVISITYRVIPEKYFISLDSIFNLSRFSHESKIHLYKLRGFTMELFL